VGARFTVIIVKAIRWVVKVSCISLSSFDVQDFAPRNSKSEVRLIKSEVFVTHILYAIINLRPL
jgi:hypothetical protein